MPESREVSRFTGRNIVDKDRPKTDEEAYALARERFPDDPFPYVRVTVECESGTPEDHDFTNDPVLLALRRRLGFIEDTSIN